MQTLRRKTGVRSHVARLSVALKLLGARRGRPRPMVNCPWSARAKQRKLRDIRPLADTLPADTLPADEVLVCEDEVDIPLNPTIGPDGMVCGQQQEVVTPGQNEKRDLAGAPDVRTGQVLRGAGQRKDRLLFLRLLWELVRHNPPARVIHVVLDNDSIHHTQQVAVSLTTEPGQRLRRHFLPPYCPDHNRIERTWEDPHANVTRNHTCRTMPQLRGRVRSSLRRRNSKTRPTTSQRPSHNVGRVRQSRTVI